MRFVSSGALSRGEIGYTASTTVWISFYVNIESAAPANIYIAEWRSGGTKIGDIRVNSGTTSLTLRDNNTAPSGMTTAALGTGLHRVSIRVTPGSATGHELRVYSGSNRHGTTPDFSATGAATSAGQSSSSYLILGINTVSTWSVGMDRLRIDDAAEPAGVQVPLSFGSVTATGWSATGGSAIGVLSDTDDATFLTSPTAPSGSVTDLVLPPVEPPAGDLPVTLRASRVDASSGSVAVTLRDGSTTVATATVTGTIGTSLSNLTATFAAANISSVTTAKWRAGTLVVRASWTTAA